MVIKFGNLRSTVFVTFKLALLLFAVCMVVPYVYFWPSPIRAFSADVWTCCQSVRFREISFCHAAYFYTTILEATTTTANPSKGSLMQSMWLCVLQNQSPLLHVLATRGLQEGQPLFCQKNHRRVRAVHITTPPNFEKKSISYWHFVIIFWNTLWVQNCLENYTWFALCQVLLMGHNKSE